MHSLDDITIPLEPGNGYHIFNRGNEGRPIFFKERNYEYFLKKYQVYMCRYWDTQAYCLLTNHFHLAVKLKNHHEIILAGRKHFSSVSKGFLKEHWPEHTSLHLLEPDYNKLSNLDYLNQYLTKFEAENFLYRLSIWTVSERFRRFLLGYAKAINVQENRHGSLFQKLFRRKVIPGGFSRSLVAYIHRNPIHHHYCHDLASYAWSSYLPLLNDQTAWLDHQEVMINFAGKDQFKAYHLQAIDDWRLVQALIMEE